MDEEVNILNIGELPDMDKEVSLKIDFTTLIIVCTAMTMYSDYILNMIEDDTLPTPIGETMLQNVDKVIEKFHYVMAMEGNEIYKALYENTVKEGTIQ